MKRFFLFLVMMLLVNGLITEASAKILYVDSMAQGDNNGSSWEHAYIHLQDGLANVASGDEIWVTSGIYKPDLGVIQTLGNREASFHLASGVSLYGGFDGTENMIEERDWIANAAILSGDLNGNDIGFLGNDENSYHVVTVTGNSTDDVANLDGFVITGGNDDAFGPLFPAQGKINVDNPFIPIPNEISGAGGMLNQFSTVTVANCTFRNNSTTAPGGAVVNFFGEADFVNCFFADNSALVGGAVLNIGSSLTLANCVFTGNLALAEGGAVADSIIAPTTTSITNCTFTSNSGNVEGALAITYEGDAADDASVVVKNSIFWNDSIDEIGIITNNTSGTATFLNCNIRGSGGSVGWDGSLGTDGGSNIDINPIFLNSADRDGADDIFGTNDDGLQLQNSSPSIDTGTAAGAPAADVLGIFRPRGAGYDMGAYEFFEEADTFVALNRVSYLCNSTVSIIVHDFNRIENKLPVSVSTQSGDSETVMMSDINGDKIYIGRISIGGPGDAILTGDNILQGQLSDMIKVIYNDEDDGSGNSMEISQTAVLDCELPGISNVQLSNIGTSQFTVDFDVSESVQAIVNTGLSCGETTDRHISNDQSHHSVTITGLTECTPYYFSIEVIDLTGNTVIENNGGRCYSVITYLSKESTVFFDDFEGSAGVWTGNGLWHVINGSSNYPESKSGEHSWWYGSELTGDYNDPPFNRNFGELRSPPILLPDDNSLSFTFASWEETEGGTDFDKMTVFIDDPDGSHQLHQTHLNMSSWQNIQSIDISEFGGREIQLVFMFDTLDERANNFRGWYIDDVSITAIETVSCDDQYRSLNLNKDAYACDQMIEIEVADVAVNSSTLSVTVISTAGDSESVTLTDVGGDRIYRGSIIVSAAENPIGAGNGILQVFPTDTFTATYVFDDANTTDSLTVTVDVDCVPPEITVFPLEVHLPARSPAPDVLEGIGVTDNRDNDLTERITVGGDAVDTDTVDTYVVSYDVSDAAGNAAVQQLRTYHVFDNVVLSIEPTVTRIAEGASFSLDVIVNSVSQPVSEVHIFLNFDAAIAKVDMPTPAIVFSEVTENNVDNLQGHVNFRAKAFPVTPEGRFTVATIGFTLLAPLTNFCYPLSFNNTSPRKSDLFFNNESVLNDLKDSVICGLQAIWFVDLRATNGLKNGTSWDNAYLRLQDALAIAGAGDEIWVAGGIYAPAPANGDRYASFQLVEDVKLLGGFSGTENSSSERRYLSHVTILSGDLNGDDFGYHHNDENSYHVVTGHNTSPETIIDGFMIIGGNANGSDMEDSGAGIYIELGKPTIRNCIIMENSATDSGGGMFIADRSSATIINSIFVKNNAGFGGGLYLENFEPILSSPQTIITDCEFQSNQSVLGGGMAIAQTRAILTGCQFEKNLALDGGGLYNMFLATSSMRSCKFVRNTAVRTGGGIAFFGGFPGGQGEEFSIEITNCLILANSAERGGAFDNIGYHVTITNSGIIDNFAEFETGGILNKSSVVNIANTILWGNIEDRINLTPNQLSDVFSVTNVTSSIVEGGVSSSTPTEPSPSPTGPFFATPMSVFDIDPLMTVDRHLMQPSPAIDIGTEENAPLTDIDNENRPAGAGFDIGPDEFIDTDIDGLPDWMEQQITGDLISLDRSSDFDLDGLDNLTEYHISTNPAHPDSDFDGLFDGEEIQQDIETGQYLTISDPLHPDTLLAPSNPFSDFTPEPSELVYDGRHSFLRDLDGDGDLDLVYSLIDGNISYVENTGTVVNRAWRHHGVIGLSSGSRLGVGDVDADGDMDLILVTREGFFIKQNNGVEALAENQWDAPQRIGIDVNQLDDGELHLLDIVDPAGVTGRDGFWDLVVVHADGQMTLIANDGDGNPLTWMPHDRSWAGSTVFRNVSETMGDIDSDGDLDRFVGLDLDNKPVFQQNVDNHLLMFPRYITIAQGDEQIIEVTVDDELFGSIEKLELTIVQNTSKSGIEPFEINPETGTAKKWRYTAGVQEVGVDIIQGTLKTNDGAILEGLVVVNVISAAAADLTGKALIVVGTRSDSDPLYPVSERLAVYAYVVCRQQGYAADNIRLLTPDGKLFSGDERRNNTTHLGWNVQAYGENVLLESIIKGPWAGSADDLLLYFVDHGIVDDGAGQLLLSSDFRVSSTELNQWLNLWQTVDKKATVIVDTCYSGRFISELQAPPSPNRIILASTQPGQLAHFQAAGIISFSQIFWDELSAGSTIGAAYLQAKTGLTDLKQKPSLDFTGDGIADDDLISESEIVREFGNPALLSGVQRPLVRDVMEDATAVDEAATLWVNAGDIFSNNGVERVFAYIAPPTLETDVDNGSAIIEMNNAELIDFVARRRIAFQDFNDWQILPDSPNPFDPGQPFPSYPG